jgi:hypothetical protein
VAAITEDIDVFGTVDLLGRRLRRVLRGGVAGVQQRDSKNVYCRSKLLAPGRFGEIWNALNEKLLWADAE